MMNKLLTSLLVGVLFFTTNLAAQPTFSISPQNVSAQVNDVISFDVTVSDFTNLVSMQYSINWDPAVLTFGSLSNINSGAFPSLNASSIGTPPNLDEGLITLIWFDDDFSGETVPDGTVVFTFTLTAIADGDAAVEFSGTPTSIEILDVNFADVGMNPQNSNVTVGDGGGNPSDFDLIIADATVNTGDQFCLPITTQGFNEVLGMQFSFDYDPTALGFVSVQGFNLDGLVGSAFGTPPSTNDGDITMVWFDDDFSSETLPDGTAIFEICFEALNGPSTDVSITGSPTSIEISDMNGGIIPFTGATGTVTINGGGGNPENVTMTLSDETVTQGNQVCTDVSVDGFNNIGSVQLSINYDPAQLEFVSVGSFTLPGLDASDFSTPPVTSMGDITLNWSNAGPGGQTVSDGTAIFQVCFNATGTGSTDVSFSSSPTSINLTDGDGDSANFTGNDGTITIEQDMMDPPFECPNGSDFYLSASDASGDVGDQVCVQISTCNFTDVLGMQFSINYDPTHLQFQSVGGFNLDGLVGSAFGTPPSTSDGDITMVWFDDDFSSETLPNGTVIFEVCFEALSEGTSQVSFSGSPTSIEISDENGGIIPFNSDSGAVSIGQSTGNPPFSCPNGSDFYLSIADGNVELGEEVCVAITSCNFTDILGAQLSINYDPSALEFVSLGNFNLPGLDASDFGAPPSTSDGNITLVWFDDTFQGIDMASDETLFEICFEGIAEGSSVVNFSGSPTSIEISDSNGGIIDFNSDSGVITVGEGMVEPGSDLVLDVSSALGDNGDQVCLDVAASNFTDLTDVAFSLSYDPLVLEFVSVGAFNLTGLNNGDFDTGTAGQIGFDWSNGSGVTVPANTDIFEICFNIVGDPGDESDVAFTNFPQAINVTSSGGQPVVLDGRDGNVTVNFDPNALTLEIQDIDVDQDENFCIDITTLNFIDVVGMQFTVNYDPNELAFQSVGAFNLPGLDVNDFGLPGGGGTTDGVITLQWFDETLNGVDLSNGDAVFEICFQALGDCGTFTPVTFGNTPTSIEVSDVNSMVFDAQLINSTVAICALTPIVIASPANITDVACNGESNGAIDITVSGGSGCYNFQWDYENRTTEDLAGIPAGTYNVTITDCTAGLTATATYMVEQPAPLFLNPVTQNPTCAGGNDGSIDLNISGGTQNYTINWNGSLQDDLEIQNSLVAGFYTAIVNDVNGCLTQTGNIQLVDPDPIVITLTPQPMNGGNPGSIVSMVQGTTGTPSYSWTGPNGFTSNLPNITGLTDEGDYCLTVSDASSCSELECTFLTQALNIDSGVNIVRSCPDESTGAIFINVSGGCIDPEYGYSWTGPNGFSAITQDIEGLAPGDYTVVVTDCDGTSVSGAFEVTTFDPITIGATIIPISGNPSNSNGGIQLINGNAAYNYQWLDGPSGTSRSDLGEGEYCVQITNTNTDCTLDTCFYVFFPLTYTDLNINDISCNGLTDGSISFEVFGGMAPYTVMYNAESANTGDLVQIQNLTAGEYNVSVLDALGNVIEIVDNPVVINEPDALVIDEVSTSLVHDTEDAGCTGSISLDITGGTGDYDVVWNTSPTGPDITGLCAGCYTPTVTDENGCTTTLENCIEITEFAVSGTEDDVACPDDIDGSIDLTISGGDQPYEITWSHGPNTDDVNNLEPGTYTVSVTEQSGNTLVREFIIGVGSNLGATAQILSNYNGFSVSCADATDGIAQLFPQNGTGPYTYEWTLNDQLISVDQVLQNVGAGQYIGTVIDQDGCTVDIAVDMIAAPPVTLETEVIDVSCFQGNDGQAMAFATSGVGTFTYNWSNGDSGFGIGNLTAGSYMVTATDENNCDAVMSILINQPDPLVVNVLSEPQTDKDNCDGMLSAVVTGGTPPYTYKWFGDPNLNEAMLTNLCAGDYPLEIEDSEGCTTELLMPIVENDIGECLDTRNVITPDGDGLNEEFYIQCVESLKDNHLEIYSRWGQKLYEVDGYQNDWIGRDANGELLPEGAYYFVLEYTNADNQRVQEKGSITIIREE